MRWSNGLVALVLSVVLSMGVVWAADQKTKEAKVFFHQFTHMGRTFNPDIMKYYPDDAVIHMTKVDASSGAEKYIQLNGEQYRQTLKIALPLAKARHDTSEFSRVSYIHQGNKVRIRAQRYSNLHNYASPYWLVVSKNDAGQWRIVEEFIQVQR